MASASTGDPTLLIVVVLLIVGFFAYAYLNKYLTGNKRKALVRAFRAAPVIRKDAPILVQGPAIAPDHVMPTTGEHVAYYGLFVLSRETAISDSSSRFRIQGLPTSPTRITGSKGFRFFEQSGDFLVSSQGTQYLVGMAGAYARFAKGAEAVGSLAGGVFKNAGLPGQMFDDAMGFEVALAALGAVFGFDAPIGQSTSKRGNLQNRTTSTFSSVLSATSRIDARVHYFLVGGNMPKGILDLLAKRNIVPEDKEEIIVVETFIPLNREVSVFGTYDGDGQVVFQDGTVELSVSYGDPGGE